MQLRQLVWEHGQPAQFVLCWEKLADANVVPSKTTQALGHKVSLLEETSK